MRPIAWVPETWGRTRNAKGPPGAPPRWMPLAPVHPQRQVRLCGLSFARLFPRTVEVFWMLAGARWFHGRATPEPSLRRRPRSLR